MIHKKLQETHQLQSCVICKKHNKQVITTTITTTFQVPKRNKLFILFFQKTILSLCIYTRILSIRDHMHGWLFLQKYGTTFESKFYN